MEECMRRASGMYGSAELTRSGGGCPDPQQLDGSSCETDEEGDEEGGDSRTMEKESEVLRPNFSEVFFSAVCGAPQVLLAVQGGQDESKSQDCTGSPNWRPLGLVKWWIASRVDMGSIGSDKGQGFGFLSGWLACRQYRA
ncbi:hypothetical protein C8F04DRAFT_1243310 [Mycena alexandri]|uniref:Uncharacterized protein n=1 Tax=Mycena alexandri TaxID=1745969 RepID=A0AAD6RZL1_9AGAR|nr:hypothetical protein C8F04DRAFT_1243310 [Mycena alexandri]